MCGWLVGEEGGKEWWGVCRGGKLEGNDGYANFVVGLNGWLGIFI